MKKLNTLLFATVIGLSSLSVSAQEGGPSLPAASPAASVSQTFGLTKIDINYSSPCVKKAGVERQIWGGLVPYDSVWRTGANQCTTINFSTDVMLGGQKIKKGKYALFTIPGRNSWTIIINSNADQWGAYNYKKSLDIVRLTATAQPADMKERMAFMIDPTSDSTAMITLRWEKLRVSFDVMADTKEMVEKTINDYASNTWHTYANLANYNVDNNIGLTEAHTLAELSITMKEHFFNRYVMAKVLHAEGNIKEALKFANEAKTIGDKTPEDGFYIEYKEAINQLIAELNAAAPAEKKKK